MTTPQIIAQIIGFALIVLCIISPQMKTKSGILLFNLLANFLFCAQFYFVDAKAGLLSAIVATIRSLVFLMYSQKGRRAPFVVLVLFIAFQVCATYVGWNGWVSVLTLALALNTYGQWQNDVKKMRVDLLVCTLLMGVYCVLTTAYMGAINEWMQTGSCAVALWRFREVTNEEILQK